MSENRVPQPVEPEHQNVASDFYVENDTCLRCAAPEHEAPDLIGWDPNTGSCCFKRQPATAGELDHAINAVAVSCVQGLRYHGNDPAIWQRLVERGAGDCCDLLPPASEPPIVAARGQARWTKKITAWLMKIWPAQK